MSQKTVTNILFSLLVLGIVIAVNNTDIKIESVTKKSPKDDTNIKKQNLKWYVTQKKTTREKICFDRFAKFGEENLGQFNSCMSSYAFFKKKEILIDEVFKWCEDDFKNKKNKFNSFYNELDRNKKEEMPYMAYTICKEKIKKRAAESQINFSNKNIIYHGKEEYTVAVNANNKKAICRIQYNRVGDYALSKNWEVVKLSISN